MNRLSSYLLTLSGALALCYPVVAQDVSPTTVSSAPAGSTFVVDGQQYTQPTTFNWATGSKHILQWVPNSPGVAQIDSAGTTKYTFTGWTENTGGLTTGSFLAQTVTADPSVTAYKANVTVTYLVSFIMYFGAPIPPNSASPPACAAPGDIPPGPLRPGVVYVNGACYWNSFSMWVSAGQMTLNAFPFPGFLFQGWSINTQPLNAFLSSYNITGPITFYPYFTVGKRAKFVTDPTGFQVTVDKQVVPTPPILPCDSNHYLPPIVNFGPMASPTSLCIGEFDFAMDSKHVLSAPSPQIDIKGKLWVLDSYSISNGTGTLVGNVYTANSLNSSIPDNLTAKFLPAVGATFNTLPTFLHLLVDGRDDWPSNNFLWGLGQTHTVTAPANATDANGRKYVFKSWSNGGDATQTFKMDQQVVLSINYDRLYRTVIQATIPNVTFSVDGSDCNSPCTVDKAAGSTASVTTPASLPLSPVTRLDFVGWQDGAPANRTITFAKDYQTVGANYIQANKVTVVVDPPGAATVDFSPPSPDGFYRADAQLSLIAGAKPGYQFLHWEGDSYSLNKVITINTKAPRIMRAVFAKVPYIPPAGVRNAADSIPAQGVAPGSLISIFGSSLAKTLQIGPSNPLTQTLAGTEVLLGDRLLPLIYVSPDQINAELPEDVDLGDYTLTVRTDGQQDVSAKMTVIRNAPGLFINTVNGVNYAFGIHEDGTIITPDSPAKPNELITILGTGFGPYQRKNVEGFPVPATPVNPLVDKVDVWAGTVKLTPDSVAAAQGFVGVTAVKFRLTKDVPTNTTLDFKTSVGGQESNTLQFPVQ